MQWGLKGRLLLASQDCNDTRTQSTLYSFKDNTICFCITLPRTLLLIPDINFSLQTSEKVILFLQLLEIGPMILLSYNKMSCPKMEQAVLEHNSSLLLEVFRWKLDNKVSVLIILNKETMKEVHLSPMWLHISSCKPTYTEFITKPYSTCSNLLPHTWAAKAMISILFLPTRRMSILFVPIGFSCQRSALPQKG